MIKIELIKFEAQDVITVSETKPTSVKPSVIVPMDCTIPGCPLNYIMGKHTQLDHIPEELRP